MYFCNYCIVNVQVEHLSKYFLKNEKESKGVNSNLNVNDGNEEHKYSNYTAYQHKQ